MSEYKSRKVRSCYTHVSDDGARVGFPPQFTYSTVCYNRSVLIFVKLHILLSGVSGEKLIPLVWRAIRMLQLVGLTVISVVADGASTNRKFFRLHKISKHQKSGITYKAPNISDPGRFV